MIRRLEFLKLGHDVIWYAYQKGYLGSRVRENEGGKNEISVILRLYQTLFYIKRKVNIFIPF